jgi:hypothetical protein
LICNGGAAERTAELTRVAHNKIEQLEKEAKHAIERASVEIQTKLVADGLESTEAKTFLDSMPTAEQLMPMLTKRPRDSKTTRRPGRMRIRRFPIRKEHTMTSGDGKITYRFREEAIADLRQALPLLEFNKFMADRGQAPRCPPELYSQICHALDFLRNDQALTERLAPGCRSDGSVEFRFTDEAWALLGDRGGLGRCDP